MSHLGQNAKSGEPNRMSASTPLATEYIAECERALALDRNLAAAHGLIGTLTKSLLPLPTMIVYLLVLSANTEILSLLPRMIVVGGLWVLKPLPVISNTVP